MRLCARPRPIGIASFSALVMAGCSASPPPQVGMVAAPTIVDPTPLRCPPLLNRDESYRWVKRPSPPVTTDGDRAWHDAQDAAIARKNGVIASLTKDYETCRSGGATGRASS